MFWNLVCLIFVCHINVEKLELQLSVSKSIFFSIMDLIETHSLWLTQDQYYLCVK